MSNAFVASTWCIYLVHLPGASTWCLYLVHLPGASTWCIYPVLYCSYMLPVYFPETVADLSSIHSMLNITDSAKFKTYLSINDGMKPRLPSTMPALPTLSDKPMPIVVIKKVC